MGSDITLGHKIKHFRQRKGLSQLDLEMAIDASNGVVSRIESNKVNPTKETINKIVKILGLNELEISYLTGEIANPVSENEVAAAKEVISHYFDRKGVFAYMVDERSRVWDVSKDFLKLFGVSVKKKDEVMGQSILRILLDDSLGLSSIVSKEEFEAVLYNLFFRTISEMGFMVNDEYYEEALAYIQNHEIANKVWEKVKNEQARSVHSLDTRKVVFNVKGIKVSTYFSVEPVLHNERFRIVEYIPTNTIIRLVSKL